MPNCSGARSRASTIATASRDTCNAICEVPFHATPRSTKRVSGSAGCAGDIRIRSSRATGEFSAKSAPVPVAAELRQPCDVRHEEIHQRDGEPVVLPAGFETVLLQPASVQAYRPPRAAPPERVQREWDPPAELEGDRPSARAGFARGVPTMHDPDHP